MKKTTLCGVLALSAVFSASIYADGDATFSGVTNGAPNLLVLTDPTSGADGTQTAEILSTNLSVPGSKKSLLIGVSLESSILTAVKKKGLPSACAGVEVTVKIDGTPIEPQNVHYNTRCQGYNADLADITTCTDANSDGHLDMNECQWTDEEIQNIMDTTSANHFNFIASNVGQGPHTISVDATVFANGATQSDLTATQKILAKSKAVVNVGTLSVQVVRSKAEDDDSLDAE